MRSRLALLLSKSLQAWRCFPRRLRAWPRRIGHSATKTQRAKAYPREPRRAPPSSTRPTCTRAPRRSAHFSAISPRAPTCTSISPARSMPRPSSATPAKTACASTRSALSFAKPPCRGKTLIPAQELSGNIAPADQALYDKLIDSFSRAQLCRHAQAGASTTSSLPPLAALAASAKRTSPNGSTKWPAAPPRRTTNISS